MADDFKPPPLSAHQGPAEGFTPPPLTAEEKPVGETTFSETGFPGLAKTMGHQLLNVAMEPGESLVTGARQLGQPGERLAGAGNMLKGVGKAALMTGAPEIKALRAIPTTAKAGELFDQAMAAAKDVPVDVSHFAEPVLRARKINAVAGDAMAPVLRKAVGRIGPTTEPLTYGDARIMASSAGRKAAQEAMAPNRLTGEMGKTLADTGRGLDRATQEAANTAGVGDIHANAMKTYARAKALQTAGKNIAKVAIPAAGIATGYKLGRALGVIPDSGILP